MNHKVPQSGTAFPRGLWPWLAVLAVAAALAGAGAALLPGLSQRVDVVIREAVVSAARESGLSVEVGPATLSLPATVRVARVQVGWQEGGQLYLPGVTLGVDLPAAVVHPREPARSLRRIEASGVVIRPGQPDPAPDPGAGSPDQGPLGPTSLSERVAQARQAVLDLLRQLPSGLGWIGSGDNLSWRLEGVWEEPGARPGEWIRTPWRTSGQLRATGAGRLEAEGTLEVGAVRFGFLAVASSEGAIEVRRLTVDQQGLQLSATGSVRLVQGEALDLTVSGSARWAPPLEGLGPLKVDWKAQGAWSPQSLPPFDVTLVTPAVGPEREDWTRLLGGVSATVRLVQGPEGVELARGSLRKGDARGRFSGRVGDAWPHAARIDFEVAGLKPGTDLPWWQPYAVSSLDARGRLSGSAQGPWTVDADVQAPAGRLLDLATSGVMARVSVDLTSGRATVEEMVAAAGSGLLTLGARVLWGPSAPAVAGGLQSLAVLELSGKLEGVASTELLTAARAALRHLYQEPAPEGRSVESPQGDVTGSFDAQIAWIGSSEPPAGAVEEPTRVTLVRARFDGPDGSLQIIQQEPDRFDVQGDLINLGGRALRPWLRSWRGYAAFAGRVEKGILEGRLTVQRLGAGDYELGSLTGAVRFDGERWEASDVQLRGGDVQGELALRVGADLRSGTARFSLRQEPGDGPGAAAEGSLQLDRTKLSLQDVLFTVQGREVARLGGSVPLAVLGADARAGMDVRARMERFPLELVQQLLPAWQIEGGRLTGELALTGTLEAPTASGRLLVQAGRVASRQERLSPLTDLVLELRLDGRHLRLVQGRARSAEGGDLQLAGEAQLAAVWPVRLDPVDVQVEVRRTTLSARPSDSVELHATFTGRLRWAGVLDSGRWPTLSGRLGVSQGRATFWGVTGLGGGSQPLPGAGGQGMVRLPETLDRTEGRPAAARGIPLDITVQADEPVRLEVPAIGGTALAEGAIQITGTTAEPALAGDVVLLQARVRYFGREFAIERGRLSFSPARGLVPEVDLEATTSTPDGPVRVRVQGPTSDASQLRLSAQPEMSRDEILALLLGTPGQGDAASREGWLARINEQLAAWAVGPLEQAVRSALGLDELSLVPGGADGTLRLLAGKYLTPSRIYVRYRRELLQPDGQQELELSFRLRPDLTWTLTWDDAGAFRLGFRWQRSF